jgi:hypothetical protein
MEGEESFWNRIEEDRSHSMCDYDLMGDPFPITMDEWRNILKKRGGFNCSRPSFSQSTYHITSQRERERVRVGEE